MCAVVRSCPFARVHSNRSPFGIRQRYIADLFAGELAAFPIPRMLGLTTHCLLVEVFVPVNTRLDEQLMSRVKMLSFAHVRESVIEPGHLTRVGKVHLQNLVSAATVQCCTSDGAINKVRGATFNLWFRFLIAFVVFIGEQWPKVVLKVAHNRPLQRSSYSSRS